MTTEKNGHFIKGDRALSSKDDDKLGFRSVASRIAKSLIDRASEEGLVVGVEGAWGSGKSSLLFLIGEELKKQVEAQRPTVINFRPWLVGSRDALITSLFSELSNQLARVASEVGNAKPEQKAKAKAAEVALRRFIGGLSSAGSIIEVVGDASGFAPIKYFGKGAKAIGEMAKGKSNAPQLSELKDELSKSLKELGHRFIITIDDVDRLEPAEVIEVLRLVRSVVDLPNVIYLLCYDSEVLAQCIEKAVGVHSGKDFLEKIVQLTVMVPKPEPLQLRQWFTDDLHLLASVKNDDELSRLKTVIDYEGGRQLKTPRSVVRALDAIRFFWPPLNDLHADLADLVWLQLIKDGNPKLYRWIEDYCATATVVSLGIARVETAEKLKVHAELFNSIPEGQFSDAMYLHHFAEQLPGVDVDHSDGANGISIFGRVADRDRDEAIQNRRLTSPDHYRFYFALIDPSSALTQLNVTSIWEGALNGAEQTGTALLGLHEENLSGSLTKADLLLERLKGHSGRALSSLQSENILIAFSCVLDEAHRRHPFDGSWIGTIWERAQDAMPILLSKLAPGDHDRVITAMFNDGVSIGWLTSILRYETFAHGIYGKEPRPEPERLFTTEQVNHIIELMLNRYRKMSADQIFDTPKPISLLFAWRQAGDPDGPRQLIGSNISSDREFVRTLENLTSTIISSNRGTCRVLKRENVDDFLDFDQAVQRIKLLKEDPTLGERATLLATAVEDARYF
jgi:hypothetical protein